MMMKIKLIPDNSSAMYWSAPDKHPPVIGQVDSDIVDVCNLIKIYDDYYDVCMIKSSTNECYVRHHKETVHENTDEIDELETTYTSEIVCPFCGYTFDNSFEYGEYDDDLECPACKATMSMTADHIIEYTTTLKTPGIIVTVKE